MPLREWQLQFQRAVLGEEGVDQPALSSHGLSRELSLGIYANAYRERLHEALRSNFPALHQLLGDSDFAELAYAFTAAQPPTTASIRWFGAQLPNYLRNKKPYCDLPIFAELAQFEWALRHTIDAGDAKRIDTEYLQSLPAERWEAFTCDVHPSLTILHFEWNAPQVWRALDAEEVPPTPAPFSRYWFVYRGGDLTSEWRSADACEAQAIQLWSRGENFSAICAFVAEQLSAEKIGDADTDTNTNAAVATAASFMRTWVEHGLLTFSPLPSRGEGPGERANTDEEKNNARSH
ncbi:MAG: DNA-binding domain-containing protein [Spongiibacteraceae bacterium]